MTIPSRSRKTKNSDEEEWRANTLLRRHKGCTSVIASPNNQFFDLPQRHRNDLTSACRSRWGDEFVVRRGRQVYRETGAIAIFFECDLFKNTAELKDVAELMQGRL